MGTNGNDGIGNQVLVGLVSLGKFDSLTQRWTCLSYLSRIITACRLAQTFGQYPETLASIHMYLVVQRLIAPVTKIKIHRFSGALSGQLCRPALVLADAVR